MKNMHLLGIVVGLGALSALLCLLVVIRENSNARRLEELTAEFQQARKSHEAREDRIASELKKVRETLAAEHKATADELRGKISDTNKQLGQVREDLKAAENILVRYEAKDWLAKSENVPPWNAPLNELEKKLAGALKKSLDDLAAKIEELQAKKKGPDELP